MPQRKSNNAYYKNADITRPLKNLEKIMGLSGTADSDYLTGLGKVSRLEGTELDNRKKRRRAEALQRALGVEGLGPLGQYMRHLATGSGDLMTGVEKETLLPGKEKLQGFNVANQQVIRDLFDRLSKTKQRLPSYIDSPEGREKGAREDQLMDDMTLEDAARKIRLLYTGKEPTSALDMTGGMGRRKEAMATKLTQAKINYENTKSTVAKRLGGKKVDKIDEEIREIGDRILLKRGLNATQIMEIKNRVLNEIAKLDQTILTETGKRLTEEKRRGLIAEKMKTEAENLLGAGALTSKRISEAVIARKKLWATSGDLYRKQRKQEEEVKKLKALVARETDNAKIAAIKARIAEKTEKLEMDFAKHKTAKAKSEAEIAKEKLDNLKESHTEKLATLKKQLTKAEGDAEITAIKKTIAEATKQFKIDKAELDKENAALTSRKLSAELKKIVTTTPSPADQDRRRRFKEAQILKAQGEDMGDGTIPDTDAEAPAPAPAEPASPPVTRGGGLSTDNIMPNILKLMKTFGIGGDNGGNQASVSQDPMAAELAKLRQQPVASWSPIQRKKYINHAVQNLGLDPQAAASLLQRAIQAQGPSIRR